MANLSPRSSNTAHATICPFMLSGRLSACLHCESLWSHAQAEEDHARQNSEPGVPPLSHKQGIAPHSRCWPAVPLVVAVGLPSRWTSGFHLSAMVLLRLRLRSVTRFRYCLELFFRHSDITIAIRMPKIFKNLLCSDGSGGKCGKSLNLYRIALDGQVASWRSKTFLRLKLGLLSKLLIKSF